MKILPTDVVSSGYCIMGFRRHYPALGISPEDFRTFIREGLPLERFEGHEDHMVQRVVATAKERIARDG